MEHKMHDLGKETETGMQPTEVKGEKKISYPSFSISGDQIPDELGDVKNGEKASCHIIVRKIGDNIDTYAKDEPRRIELEIHKLGCMGKSEVNEDEYKNMSDEEKDKADEKEVMKEE